MNIELHTSNKLIAENVGKAYKLYKSYVNTIGLTPPTVTEEYEENDIQPKIGENVISSIKPEKDNGLASVAAAGVGLFDNDDETSANNTEEDCSS